MVDGGELGMKVWVERRIGIEWFYWEDRIVMHNFK